MAAVPSPFSPLQLQAHLRQTPAVSLQLKKWGGGKLFVKIGLVGFRRSGGGVVVKAVSGDFDGKSDGGVETRKLLAVVNAVPPLILSVKKKIFANPAISLGLVVVVFVIGVRQIFARKQKYNQRGSVADLVKRGQLRHDRRGISTPLKYDDPFNNPLVKVKEGNSTVEMCGKVYRMAPVTLTKEQQSSHQQRRSRAYQWKRPTIFLKEGDPIPPDVDPETVRWIPANHPFATTTSELNEELVQSNVYQKNGIPFRIKAEHEALQNKLEALQREQKLDKIVLDPSNIKEFERPFKTFSKPHEEGEHNTSATSPNGSLNNTMNLSHNESKSSSEEESWKA